MSEIQLVASAKEVVWGGEMRPNWGRKKVVCPRCGREGWRVEKNNRWATAVYIVHSIFKNGGWTKVWHRVGTEV